MTDQCKHCDLKGNLSGCKEANCSQHENWYSIEQQKLIDELQKLRPMSEAPRDIEILAYDAYGKSLPQVYWSKDKACWTMRWCPEYQCHDERYAGWISIPEVAV